MELVLSRIYHESGTNGLLTYKGKRLCYTIELPWRNNKTSISCIPEGRYRLLKRSSWKFGNHLLVSNVPGRSLILMHPANDALKQLQGCIAPVTTLTGPGHGDNSRVVCKQVTDMVYTAIDYGEQVFLRVTSASALADSQRVGIPIISPMQAALVAA